MTNPNDFEDIFTETRAETLARLRREFLENSEALEHPGECQCWNCGGWHEDRPDLEECPHCNTAIPPF
jgi:rubrerythrin